MKIALLTTGRHDLSYLTPLYEAMRDDAVFFGLPDSKCSTDLDAANKTAGAMGMTIKRLHEERPDVLVVLGDRTETLAACMAATCMKVPIAHIHGGDVTLGAIDNACRHAISQLACLHFAATPAAVEKLRSMDVPGQTFLTGSPAVDLILRKNRVRTPGNDIVFAYHPETLSDVPIMDQIQHAVDVALSHLPEGGKVICVGANPDAGGKQINDYLAGLGNPFIMRTDLGSEAYWDLLSTCHCLVGNSSSGVIECPVLGVPFVEIGDRQKGRARGSYGDGRATERIVAVLRGEPSTAA